MPVNPKERQRVTFGFNVPPGPLDELQINFKFQRPGFFSKAKPEIKVTQIVPQNKDYLKLVRVMKRAAPEMFRVGLDPLAFSDDMLCNSALIPLAEIVQKIYRHEGQRNAFSMFQGAFEELITWRFLQSKEDVMRDEWIARMEELIENAVNNPGDFAKKPKPTSQIKLFNRR